MPVFVELLATIAVFAVILTPLWWLRTRLRRTHGSVMNPFDEMFHPAAAHFRHEIQIQSERRLPIPSPGDPPDPAKITITAPQSGSSVARLGPDAAQLPES